MGSALHSLRHAALGDERGIGLLDLGHVDRREDVCLAVAAERAF
jgi:hypothetical protein